MFCKKVDRFQVETFKIVLLYFYIIKNELTGVTFLAILFLFKNLLFRFSLIITLNFLFYFKNVLCLDFNQISIELRFKNCSMAP